MLVLIIGATYGAVAAFAGGWVDNIMMRITDILYTIPDILLIILLGMALKDPLDKLVRFRERDYLTFPLLSDADLTVHRLYGAYGEKKLYGKVYEGVIRSTFVIDGDGVIRVARYNVRAKGHVDSLLRALDKLDGSVF